MSYKVIEKNEYGVLVVDNDKHKSMGDICSQCKYLDNCNEEWMECTLNSYYLPDSEVEKLENDLKAKNDELQTRINELEEEKTTELIIEKYDYFGLITNINKTKCCNIAPITNENYCPNCGRKIIRK